MALTLFESLPPFLSIQEAAKVLRIGERQAYAAAESGELPTVRFGRTHRVGRATLARMSGEVVPEPPADTPSESSERVAA